MPTFNVKNKNTLNSVCDYVLHINHKVVQDNKMKTTSIYSLSREFFLYCNDSFTYVINVQKH